MQQIARAFKWLGNGVRAALLIAALLIVAWSFAHVLARPFRSYERTRETIELTVLHWGDRDEDEITQRLVASFEASHPGIRIKRINAGADYQTKLQTMVAGGDPPDVFFLNAFHLPIYAPRGILMDVQPFLERDGAAGELPFELADFVGEALDGFRFDGERLGAGPLYGLPMSFTPMGFYYNKRLFDEAGLAYPSAAWTWDDFERMARTITARTGVRGAAVDLRGAQLFRLMSWGEGTDLTSPDFRRVNAEDPGVRSVFARLEGWLDEPEAFKLFGDAREEIETSVSAFIGGRTAMQGIVGRWQVPKYRLIPTRDENAARGFEWGWAPVPRGRVARNMLYIAAWCIAADTEHPEAAWRLARHFATPEAQSINSGLGLALPTLYSVAASPAFSDPGVQPRDDAIFLEAVPGSTPMTWSSRTKVTRAMKDAVESVLRTKRRTQDESLAWLQEELDQIHESPLTSGVFPRTPWGALVGGIAATAGLIAGGLGWRWWRGRPGRLAWKRERAGVLFVSPWILGLAAFVALPMVASLLLSFMRWSGLATLDQAEWVGLANFRDMFAHDERFLRSIWVTTLYALISVPAGQVVALVAAMLLAQPLPGRNFFRSAWYLPTVLAGVAMAIMWRWVFDSENGLLNKSLAPVLDVFGRAPPEWFGEDARTFGVLAFAIASLWTFGGTMLIYLAGLHAIPKHLYEAAQIDGARWWGRFRHVTLPMLSPVILFNVVIAIIASFQVFTQAFIMTRGGPNDATLFYVLYVYEEAFQHHEMGYASALAWILFLVVLALTLAVMRMSRGRVHYEGTAL